MVVYAEQSVYVELCVYADLFVYADLRCLPGSTSAHACGHPLLRA